MFESEAESATGEIGPCPALNSTGGGRGLSAKYFWLEGGVGVLSPNHSWNGLTRPARINDKLPRWLRQASRAALLRGFPARDPGGAQDTARAPVRRPGSGQVSLRPSCHVVAEIGSRPWGGGSRSSRPLRVFSLRARGPTGLGGASGAAGAAPGSARWREPRNPQDVLSLLLAGAAESGARIPGGTPERLWNCAATLSPCPVSGNC